MNQRKLAEARRLYHHVCQGGTITPKDVSFMVVALEEAYERGEEPMINYIDCSDPPEMDKSGPLGDRQPEWANRMSDEEPLIDGYPLYSGLPKREWVGLTDDERIDLEDYFEIIIGDAPFDAIEARLKEKNT